MPKTSTLTPQQRSQLVLRPLSTEERAEQIARRAGVSEQTLYPWRHEFIHPGKRTMNGRGAEAERAKAVHRLEGAIAERDQMIGELTIGKRITITLTGASS